MITALISILVIIVILFVLLMTLAMKREDDRELKEAQEYQVLSNDEAFNERQRVLNSKKKVRVPY